MGGGVSYEDLYWRDVNSLLDNAPLEEFTMGEQVIGLIDLVKARVKIYQEQKKAKKRQT